MMKIKIKTNINLLIIFKYKLIVLLIETQKVKLNFSLFHNDTSKLENLKNYIIIALILHIFTYSMLIK